MMPDRSSRIYSATYSNVPVYEFSVGSNHVMRRRSDDWINATHILKVADYDKPARTRILEREVQKGVHEKVQGGYGKYQGTWVPLQEGRLLAERNGIFEKLAPIFEYIPGDRSPPPAPKHATAASNRPKAPKAPTQPRKLPVAQRSQMSDAFSDNYSLQQNDETPDNGTVVSESDEDVIRNSQYSTGSRKRKREPAMSFEDQQHVMWSDDLLDYFMLLDSEDASPDPPVPDACINLNRPIDDKGHTAMHWAAAMGDLNVVKDLLRRGANFDCMSNNGETPLIRAILFTNNYDKQTFAKLFDILSPTVSTPDWFGSTVFHHIAMTTKSKSKYACARYYLDTIVDKLVESWAPQQITLLLDRQDQNGDTAITLAARHGARKCVRSLLSRNAAVDIPNAKHETAEELIQALNDRRRDRYRPTSSSPFQQPNSINARPLQTSTTVNPPFYPGAAAIHDPPPSFRSEAAHLLSSQLPYLITSRASALAAALEQELADRELELQEVERLLAQRQAELRALQKQNATLSAKDSAKSTSIADDPAAIAADAAQKSTLDELEAESRRLLELEQRHELDNLVRAEEANAGALSIALSPILAQNHPSKTQSGSEVLPLARGLVSAQSHRRSLIAQVVTAHSRAGMSDRQADYKRLISATLGMPTDDVEAMLPEILADLVEAAGTAGTGRAGVVSGDAMEVDIVAKDSSIPMATVPDAVGVVG